MEYDNKIEYTIQYFTYAVKSTTWKVGKNGDIQAFIRQIVLWVKNYIMKITYSMKIRLPTTSLINKTRIISKEEDFFATRLSVTVQPSPGFVNWYENFSFYIMSYLFSAHHI